MDAEQIRIWDAHQISRAAENQRFIVSSNISHAELGCSTMIISPKGEVIQKLEGDCESLERIQVDLTDNSNWYLSQSRNDLIDIVKV